MTAQAYKTKSGRTLYRPVDVDPGACLGMTLEDPGFCLACGNEAYGVEPDARKVPCESCGEPMVYGLQELMIMGLATLAEGA